LGDRRGAIHQTLKDEARHYLVVDWDRRKAIDNLMECMARAETAAGK